MPRIIETTVYKFEKLSDDAKKKQSDQKISGKQLEKEWEFQNSDETIKENIIANEYEFTADGIMI